MMWLLRTEIAYRARRLKAWFASLRPARASNVLEGEILAPIGAVSRDARPTMAEIRESTHSLGT